MKEDAITYLEMARIAMATVPDTIVEEMGMSDDEIKEYDSFMSDDKRVTEENLVEVFRFLKAKESGETVNPELTQPAQQKRTSAAAVSGTTPPQGKSQEKEKDDFFKGLMKFSR